MIFSHRPRRRSGLGRGTNLLGVAGSLLLTLVIFFPITGAQSASLRTISPPFHHTKSYFYVNSTANSGNGSVLINHQPPDFDPSTGKVAFSERVAAGGCASCIGDAQGWQGIVVDFALPSHRGHASSVMVNASWAARLAWGVAWGICSANVSNGGHCWVGENTSFSASVVLWDATARRVYYPVLTGASNFTQHLTNATSCRIPGPPYPPYCTHTLSGSGILRGHLHLYGNMSAAFNVARMNTSHAWSLGWTFGWMYFSAVSGLVVGAGASVETNMATHGSGLFVTTIRVR